MSTDKLIEAIKGRLRETLEGSHGVYLGPASLEQLADEALAALRETHAVVPREADDEMLDRAVAFALNVRLSRDYNWTHYMRGLWARMIDAPQPEDTI